MKFLLSVSALSFLILQSSAYADQSATWTCSGKSLSFSQVIPYLGEENAATQTLTVIKNEISSAYFLVSKEVPGADGKSSFISGSNGKRGSFALEISEIVDLGDEGIHMTGKGVLTFRHGPLSATAEPMKCVLE